MPIIGGLEDDIMGNRRLMRHIKSDSNSNGIHILAIGGLNKKRI